MKILINERFIYTYVQLHVHLFSSWPRPLFKVGLRLTTEGFSRPSGWTLANLPRLFKSFTVKCRYRWCNVMSCGKNPFDAPIFYQQKPKGAEQRGSYIWALPRTVRVPPQKKPVFLVRNFFIYFLFGHSCTGQSPSQTHSAKSLRVSRHKIHQPWLSVVVETAGV